MKNIILILLIVVVLGAGGYFAWKKFFAGNPKTHAKVVTAENYNEPFMWGVTMRPNALGRFIDEIWKKQIKVATGLGVGWVRIGWDYSAANGFEFNDNVLKYLDQAGLKTYLVIEPKGKFEDIKDPYYDGYTNAFQIADHYKGKIKYYQIMNEAGSNALIDGTYSGENESDYDAAKYERTKEWLRGASEGVRKADPEAYRVLTSQWLQTGFLSKLQKDKIEYDIIGWDWFSDMDFMGDKKLADGTLLIDKLKSFDKPIIIAECNQRPNGTNGQKGQPETKQADFIAKMANWSVEKGLKGFYVLELLDVPNSGKGYTDYYGIVKAATSSSGTGIPGEPRQAYYTFKDIITKNTSGQ